MKYLPIEKDQYSRIVVRRKTLLANPLAQIKHRSDRKYIRVTFVGEPAVDEGGPLREFFHLLNYAIARNMLFCDNDDRRIPRHCIAELEKKSYFILLEKYLLCH